MWAAWGPNPWQGDPQEGGASWAQQGPPGGVGPVHPLGTPCPRVPHWRWIPIMSGFENQQDLNCRCFENQQGSLWDSSTPAPLSFIPEISSLSADNITLYFSGIKRNLQRCLLWSQTSSLWTCLASTIQEGLSLPNKGQSFYFWHEFSPFCLLPKTESLRL